MKHISIDDALILLAGLLGTNPCRITESTYYFNVPYRPGDQGPSGFAMGKEYVEDRVHRVNSIPDQDLPRELASLIEDNSDYKLLTLLITARLQGDL